MGNVYDLLNEGIINLNDSRAGRPRRVELEGEFTIVIVDDGNRTQSIVR